MNNQLSGPAHIWQTLLNRVMFGFQSEVNTNPSRFSNFPYIQGLINQEANVLKLYGKIFLGLLVLNTIALAYVQGTALDLNFFGQKLTTIPAFPEALCLFLGLNLFSFSIHGLDILIFARMRYVLIHKLVGTDLTNLATAHLKGNGIWADLLTPRFIGYVSGEPQKIFCRIIGHAMMIFLSAIYLASATSLVSIYKYSLSKHNFSLDWPTVISTAGLLIGTLGVLLFFSTQLIPFKFKLPPQTAAGTMPQAVLPEQKST